MSDQANEWYLFHHTPPIDIGIRPKLILTSPGGETQHVKLSELSNFKFPLVTHSFQFLVDWFRKYSFDLPANIIDIEIAKKLLVGRPKADFSGNLLPWNMLAIIKPYLPPEYDNLEINRALSTHLVTPKERDFAGSDWMLTVSGILARAWSDLSQALKNAGEYDRFYSVEVPSYQVMLDSQLNGIRVDTSKRDAFLSEVENTYITAHHLLSIKYKINIDKAFHDSSYLASCLDISNIEDMTPKDIIKSLKDTEIICSKLHEIDSTRRNKAILLRTFSLDHELCYPIYDTMGTVTGRILAVDPQLQHLKKLYRSIIVPRTDTCHIYIDYSQFEPNIMASMSHDKNLLDLCGTNDIYQSLAENLFGNRTLRKQAKTLFLAYSYGMSRKGLETLIFRAKKSDTNRESRLIIERFYRLIAGLQSWRKSIQDHLAYDGKVGTAFGNYRNRNREGPLDAREKRWSLSQVVQGTGSLILKRVICKLAKLFPEIKILLPMHDALLIEIPAFNFELLKSKIVTEFITTFRETCPDVEPRVTVGPFVPEEGAKTI